MVGETILHYRIDEKLGEGGMGEVYLAHDERLDRDVALKFLPAHVQADEGVRGRFLREARAASQLNHPNIVSLYYIEHDGDRDFIVMEYVRGRSLREAIAGKGLTLAQSLAIARDVAAALSAAHAAGIVHRDIKAENIVLTEGGRAKVLDFGLAKVEGATRITATSSTVGTVAYMSPEQTRGEEVDARSDLFSLGVLLYEMVAGRQPFAGEHRAAVTYAIVNETPEPLARYKADVPDELQRIVDKALRKDRETRYQSAADFGADIEALRTRLSSAPSAPAAAVGVGKRPAWVRWTGAAFLVFLIATLAFFASRWFEPDRAPDGGEAAAPSGPVKEARVAEDDRTMIAVIPFENLGQPDEEYFADGMTEEITARLARIKQLGVIARTSVLRYKNTELSIGEIGNELGVDYVLEGTVRWQHAKGEDARVRVTPQLIRVADDTHVWADVFDEPLTAVFEVQSEIASRVIDELNVTLVGGMSGEQGRPTTNLEAYDAYLRGYDLYYKETMYDRRRGAEKAFQRAIALDPDYADAYAWLSVIASDRYWFGAHEQSDVRDARRYAERALELDPGSFHAHLAMGMYYYHGLLDYDAALGEFDTALRIQPNNAVAIAAVAFVKRRKGDWDGAVEYLRRAVRLDPRFYQYYYELGETLVDLHLYDEAEWYIDKGLELHPESDYFVWKMVVKLARGDIEGARRVAASVPDPPEAWVVSNVYGWLDVIARDYDAALAGLKASSIQVQDTHFFYEPRTLKIALVYRLMGRTKEERVYADSARVLIEKRLEESPEDSRLYSALGLALAHLGRKDEALEAARRGVEMMPVSKESKQGPWRLNELVEVLIMVGEADEAIDRIQYLLSIPAGNLSVPYARIVPWFDPLRDNPRFQEVLAEAGG